VNIGLRLQAEGSGGQRFFLGGGGVQKDFCAERFV